MKWITREGNQEGFRGPLANIIENYRNMMEWEWIVKVSHILREQNQVVDRMAKRALSLERGWRVFDRLPCDIRACVEQDALGVPKIRRSGIND